MFKRFLRQLILIGFISAIPLVLTACMEEEQKDTYGKVKLSEGIRFDDLDSLYEDTDEIKVLYMTVGRNKQDGQMHTFREVNSYDRGYYEETGIEQYECGALIQFGNEEGPTSDEFGFGDMSENATVRLTGNKSTTRQQKSYRIKINKGSGNVDGMKTLILNKCFTDPFRFTDKLCFDLIRQTDEMVSVRTEFVHLYVRDEYEGEELFTDYGLYTMTEPVNKKYLSNRGLDSTGELYKVNDFDFKRHEGVIMNPTDAAYDEAAFEELLESKGSEDHTKLINLLDAMNDDSASIEDIVETYFDEDNLYGFMAFNILIDNTDTDTGNFYLYSPSGTDRFYIISWDHDNAFRDDYELIRDPQLSQDWKKGIYLYSESKLFGSIIRSEHCVDKLSQYIAKYHEGVLKGDHVMEMAAELGNTVKPYLYELPDRSYARVTQADYDKLIKMLPEQMDNNYYAYYDSLETPWPFNILTPNTANGQLIFEWESSSVLEGEVTYTFELSDSWDFSKVLENVSDLKETKYVINELPAGQYFVRVSAVSDSGLKQQAYQYYNTEKKTTVRGVQCFYITDDGTVEARMLNEQEE